MDSGKKTAWIQILAFHLTSYKPLASYVIFLGLNFLIFKFLFIYLFIFIYGCVGSSFLCEGFL